MAKFIIIHGSVKTERKEPYVVGDEIELEPADAKHMDPLGAQLVTPEAYAELKKVAEAETAYQAQLAKKTSELDESKPKAPPPTAKQKAAIVAAEAKKKPAERPASKPAGK